MGRGVTGKTINMVRLYDVKVILDDSIGANYTVKIDDADGYVASGAEVDLYLHL